MKEGFKHVSIKHIAEVFFVLASDPVICSVKQQVNSFIRIQDLEAADVGRCVAIDLGNFLPARLLPGHMTAFAIEFKIIGSVDKQGVGCRCSLQIAKNNYTRKQ